MKKGHAKACPFSLAAVLVLILVLVVILILILVLVVILILILVLVIHSDFLRKLVLAAKPATISCP